MKLGGKIGCLIAIIGIIVAVLAIVALLTTQMRYPKSVPMGVAVRAYLFVDEPAPPGYGAYGYLLFNAQPSPTEMERYREICASYKRSLVESFGVRPEDRAREMATFWPLQRKRGNVADYSCYTMIEQYDYRRAAEISTALHKQGARGPVLTAWTKPFEENNSADALVLDLSDFSEQDLDRAFAIWRERITMNPDAWQKGLNLVVFREAFRGLLQTYGETILAIVHPTK